MQSCTSSTTITYNIVKKPAAGQNPPQAPLVIPYLHCIWPVSIYLHTFEPAQCPPLVGGKVMIRVGGKVMIRVGGRL